MPDPAARPVAANSACLRDRKIRDRRHWSAANGPITKPQKDGDTARIAAARQRADSVYAEYDTISEAVIDKMHGIVQAGLERTDQLLRQLTRTNTARDAILDALREPGRTHG